MAVFDARNSHYGVFLEANSLEFVRKHASSPSLYSWDAVWSTRAFAHGTGITVRPDGVAYRGTATRLDLDLALSSPRFDGIDVVITGISVPVASLISTHNEFSPPPGWVNLLGGNDTVWAPINAGGRLYGDTPTVDFWAGNPGFVGGDDRINGGRRGDQTLSGDFIDVGGLGPSVIDATGGDDVIITNLLRGRSEIYGDAKRVSYGNLTAGNDRLVGSNTRPDLIVGDAGSVLGTLRGGDDTLEGRGGNDTVFGDARGAGITFDLQDTDVFCGDDVINGGAGNDLIYGDIQNGTSLVVAFGNDTMFGEAGNDRIFGQGGNDIIDGGVGNDNLSGGGGIDAIDGGSGLDTADFTDATAAVVVTLNGSTASPVTVGGVPQGTLRNIEFVAGGSGEDVLTGDGLANRLFGNGGADTLGGGGGNDLLFGGAGGDTIDGGAGVDTADFRDKTAAVELTLMGPLPVNVTVGGIIEDTVSNVEIVFGGQAGDTLTGDPESNALFGFGGADVLDGAGGNDTVAGGVGNDTLISGGGRDFFLFDTKLSSTTNVDDVTDFSVVDDTIKVDNAIFTAVGVGRLDASAFFRGAAAHDASDRFIYNAATGALLYDRDGTGHMAAFKFATLDPGLSLTHADFFVV
jgi:Ca2+-binding RTX toxin-like protein